MHAVFLYIGTKAPFSLPELMARVNGPTRRVTGFHKQLVNSASENRSICQLGPLTRVMETGLKEASSIVVIAF